MEVVQKPKQWVNSSHKENKTKANLLIPRESDFLPNSPKVAVEKKESVRAPYFL
mgnify:CR=1 FL=1